MLRFLQNNRTAAALALLSTFATAMLITRVAWTGQITFVFLMWNLFLAWVPFLLSRLLPKAHKYGILALAPLLGAWLLFFPNAPYILTDLVHLKARPGVPFWFDLVLISSFAFTGLLLGWMSLHRVHTYLSTRLRPAYGWALALLASLGAGVGVYIGRVLRWNSWDIVRKPMELASDLAAPVLHPSQNMQMIVVSIVFGAFLFAGYLVMQLMIAEAREVER